MASGDNRSLVPEWLDGTGLRAAVVRTRWNDDIVTALTEGAVRGLTDLGVEVGDVVWAPGAFELPYACQQVIRSGDVDLVVAVGAVIRGETTHYELVSEGAAEGVARVQLDEGVPIGFGVVTVENDAQAHARSEGPGGHNVGEEAAQAAVEMADLARRLRS